MSLAAPCLRLLSAINGDIKKVLLPRVLRYVWNSPMKVAEQYILYVILIKKKLNVYVFGKVTEHRFGAIIKFFREFRANAFSFSLKGGNDHKTVIKMGSFRLGTECELLRLLDVLKSSKLALFWRISIKVANCDLRLRKSIVCNRKKITSSWWPCQ